MVIIEENMDSKKNVNVLLVILSIIIPFFGVIIFLYLKKQQPKTAIISGICSLINFVIITISIPIILSIEINRGNTRVIENVSKNGLEYKLENAKDIVSIGIAEALSDYYDELNMENNTGKASLTKHVKNALIKAKKELDEDGVEIKASGNTIYLSTETKKISGTIGKDGSIKWFEIEDK